MTDDPLGAKYGAPQLAAFLRRHPASGNETAQSLDSVDRHFTKLWLDFLAGMDARDVLDARTRHLARVSQLAMLKSPVLLAEAIRSALAVPIPPREVLEVILHCVIYGGQVVLEPALRVFVEVADSVGALVDLADGQSPLDGCDADRSYDEEKMTWHPDDLADPRFEPLMARYGWHAVGRGLSLRPRHHLKVLAWHDSIDQDWAGLWARFVYQGMYGRDLVDDRTRLLCMVGNCVAVNELEQARAHMSGAMRAGAGAREVMEIILQSAPLIGMPPTVNAMRVLLSVAEKDGRLEDLGSPAER